jgi:hypothetical protein
MILLPWDHSSEIILVDAARVKRPLLADFVAKVASCRAAVFRENTRRETIADSSSLTGVAEVACKLTV